MKNSKRRNQTLFHKIIIPLVVVMVFQSLIFFASALFGGVVDTLRKNAEDVLKERVTTKGIDMQTTFSSRWTNLSAAVTEVRSRYDQLTAGAETPLWESADLQRQLLSMAAPGLISTLRANNVTGVFLILNNTEEYTPLAAGEQQKRYGICIRDYDPDSTYSAQEDLLVIRCPTSLTSPIGCSMDSWWEAYYTFNDATPGDYYYKPLEQAALNPGADYDDLAYFCGTHNLGQSDRQVVSYSVPLYDSEGKPFGVLGVELAVDYLKTMMPEPTLYGSNSGCYALVQYNEGEDTYQVITTSGVTYVQAFASANTFTATANINGILECTDEQNNIELCGCINDLTIYNHNTPFENERLAMVGLVKTDALYSISSLVASRLLVVSGLVLIIGLVTVLVVCRRITKPINDLSGKVRNMEVSHASELDRLGITEIDELVTSIEGLSEKVNRSMIRTEFFSRMSHDMRTPMNAVIGFSSPELLEAASAQQLRDYMDKIHSSGEYLLGLINEVLDMAKIEAERMELRFEAVGSTDVWNDVADMIGELAKEKQVIFLPAVEPKDCCIMADRQRLNQVLMNLLSNAVKFTPEGGTVRYTVMELYRGRTDVTYSIVVADTGRGMSEEFMQKMYEPFTQERASIGGTGLGLAITRQIVTLMHGTLTCQSREGEGTTFEVRLTFDRATEEQAQQALSGAQLPAAESDDSLLQGRHVLLCEDHPLNAQIATRLLERKGLIVDLAVNGREGLELFSASAEGYYSFVLMDIRMPVLDGLQTASAIRAMTRADAAVVPIIAMTANAFAEDVEQSKKAGMNDHLSKPIDPTILYVTLEKYLPPQIGG